jgi:broad specificity phosphatase PhoE
LRLYIVRHGEPAHVGGLDRPLTELGERQAQATGEFLAGVLPACLYVSPFRRTLETAAGIRSVLDVRALVRPKLCEWFVPEEMEHFQGLTLPQMKDEFPFLQFPPDMREDRWWPDWPETEIHVDRRAAEAVADIFNEWRSTDTAVAIVGHGASCKGALRAALSPEEWPGEDIGHDHCGISLAEGPEPGACRLIFQNRTDHRPSE